MKFVYKILIPTNINVRVTHVIKTSTNIRVTFSVITKVIFLKLQRQEKEKWGAR